MSDDKYLITRYEIASLEGREKTHFLNRNAKRLNKSLGDLTGLTGIGFHIIEIAPGDLSTEHHCHHYEDECVYVLSGNGTAFIGDEEHSIGEGDFIGYRKGGLAHSLKNTGKDPLRCIVVGQRLDHDVGDYPRLGKRLYRNKGQDWNLVDDDQIKKIDGGVGKK